MSKKEKVAKTIAATRRRRKQLRAALDQIRELRNEQARLNRRIAEQESRHVPGCRCAYCTGPSNFSDGGMHFGGDR